MVFAATDRGRSLPADRMIIKRSFCWAVPWRRANRSVRRLRSPPGFRSHERTSPSIGGTMVRPDPMLIAPVRDIGSSTFRHDTVLLQLQRDCADPMIRAARARIAGYYKVDDAESGRSTPVGHTPAVAPPTVRTASSPVTLPSLRTVMRSLLLPGAKAPL